MQFKRDTDYAIRIILFLSQIIRRQDNNTTTLKEISKETGIPYTAVRRICMLLEEKHLIDAQPRGSNYYILPISNLLEKTINDVLEAVDDEVNPFAVFDINHNQYQRLSGLFEISKRSMNKPFVKMSIGELTKTEDNQERPE